MSDEQSRLKTPRGHSIPTTHDMNTDKPTPETSMDPFSRVVHELKTWPGYFESVLSEEKTFEARKDDRGFEVGHDLRLREWNPETKEYTGRVITTGITYILRDTEHVGKGYCILGLAGGGRSHASLSYGLETTERELEKFKQSLAEALIGLHGTRTELPITQAQLAEVTRERDALRQCFAEASHDAGPAFVAHQELAQLRADLAALREGLGVIDAMAALATEDTVRQTVRDKVRRLLTAEHTPAEETKP